MNVMMIKDKIFEYFEMKGMICRMITFPGNMKIFVIDIDSNNCEATGLCLINEKLFILGSTDEKLPNSRTIFKYLGNLNEDQQYLDLIMEYTLVKLEDLILYLNIISLKIKIKYYLI